VTGGLLLLVYGLNRGVEDGWTSAVTLAIFTASAVLLSAFVRIGARSREPLVPFSSLKNRTMVAADLAAFLLFGAFFSFIFLASLPMQQLLLYSPTKTGVAWLATSVTAFVAAGITGARLVSTFGVRRLLVVGMSLAAVGLWLLTQVSPGANYPEDLLPALLLMGVAIGFSAPSVQIGALTGVAGRTVGLASGLVETMREIGGAVGIAAVSTVLTARTRDVDAIDDTAARQSALFDGFQAAFTVSLVFAVVGVVVAAIAFPRATRTQRRPVDDALTVPATAAVPSGAVD
jgi:MFS family permease